MPCRTDEDPSDHLYKQFAFLEAALCASLRALDAQPIPKGARGRPGALEQLDYVEADITKHELFNWREAHEAKDYARRKREKEQREKEELRQAGLAKLSPAERAALGIK